jgi:hypothetical protein
MRFLFYAYHMAVTFSEQAVNAYRGIAGNRHPVAASKVIFESRGLIAS